MCTHDMPCTISNLSLSLPLSINSGEKVLCSHKEHVYEAKILKLKAKTHCVMYYIHYLGWNKSWDQWVPDTRLSKINSENLQVKTELPESSPVTKGKRKKGACHGLDDLSNLDSSLPVSASAATAGEVKAALSPADTGIRNKRLKLELKEKSERESTRKREIKIKLPDEVKNWLIEDWHQMERQKKLTVVPAKVTVDEIFAQYVMHHEERKGNSGQASELCHGIDKYFNTTFGQHLLYDLERPQYDKVKQDHGQNTPMTSVYGIIHLCRLFTKLSWMLEYTELNEREIATLLSHLNDFFSFLSQTTVFHAETYYYSPPSE